MLNANPQRLPASLPRNSLRYPRCPSAPAFKPARDVRAVGRICASLPASRSSKEAPQLTDHVAVKVLEVLVQTELEHPLACR